MTGLILHWGAWLARLAGFLFGLWAVLTLSAALKDATLADWIGSIKVWVLTRFRSRTTRTKGDAPIASLAGILIWGIVLASVPTAVVMAKYYNRYPVYELHDVAVVERIQPLEYWMAFTSPVAGHMEFYARFCPDYKPGFDPGDFLTLLRYQDRGKCWDLSDHEAGYVIRRDAHGKTDSERSGQATPYPN